MIARRPARGAGGIRSASALRVAVLIGLAALASVPAGAQPRGVAKPLGKPSAELEEPLTGPLVLFELRDGRLLVHDAGEKRLAVVDLSSGAVTEVAREGAGPKEFRSVSALLRAPGDSVWLYDILQSRVLVLSPDGVPQRTELFADGANMMAMLTRPVVREHDRAGNTYGELRAMSIEGNKMTMSDSVVLVRVRRGAPDTVTKMPSFVSAPEMDANSFRMRLPGFPPTDAWGVFPDGRVMVVRGATYTPELILPDGTRRTASAIPHVRRAVTEADKAKLMADTRKQFAEQMTRMGVDAANGPRFDLLEPEQWQSQMPALGGTDIRIDAKGRAWVPLRPETDEGRRFDLLDADGRRVDTFQLPKDAQLLGFGRASVYITRKDADDLLYIQKVVLP